MFLPSLIFAFVLFVLLYATAVFLVARDKKRRTVIIGILAGGPATHDELFEALPWWLRTNPLSFGEIMLELVADGNIESDQDYSFLDEDLIPDGDVTYRLSDEGWKMVPRDLLEDCA